MVFHKITVIVKVMAILQCVNVNVARDHCQISFLILSEFKRIN